MLAQKDCPTSVYKIVVCFNYRRIRLALKGPVTRGVWGHAPQKILKSWCSETPFLVFGEDKFCPNVV